MTAPAPSSPTPAPRPGFVYFLGRVVLRPLFWVMYRPRIVGRGNVPARGPVLLASNHLAALDTVIIPTSAARPVQFLIKSSYFTGSGVLGRFKRWFFTSIGGVPVYRATGRDARAALDAGSSILRAGSVFAVFPEGTRSRDGKLHEGHGGAAWMARDTGAAVVPVGLIGTGTVKPLSHLLPGRPRLEVHFGEPLDLTDLEGVPDGKARREITERMMAAIARLSGQERSGSVNATSRD
ncbi:lysophospholipid acyltransferase family protein [Microbacterium sp. M3]|uniref:Lysophospholipid acyltransferase family protein n=1 Tax=Microbacterium arthrosphaerae TaxID=792652 RepID=A0ABU4H709_9MICO|nr:MULTISPECIES: lysophospholipid acyltransferase family protein [Microbacterium]MDW4574430.1 lysophospholipid acyltransferase family protein [Microbacterium arthrosphaerae]MDW7608285.1 lysophospholipid acyltransferase family protein [Microbacterium sp. M3]